MGAAVHLTALICSLLDHSSSCGSPFAVGLLSIRQTSGIDIAVCSDFPLLESILKSLDEGSKTMVEVPFLCIVIQGGAYNPTDPSILATKDNDYRPRANKKLGKASWNVQLTARMSVVCNCRAVRED